MTALDPYTLRAMADELEARREVESRAITTCGAHDGHRHHIRAELLGLLAGSFKSHAIRIDLEKKEG